MSKYLFLLLALGALAGGLFLVGNPRQFEVLSTVPEKIVSAPREAAPQPAEMILPKSPLTGLPCEHAGRRPVAVMLANDPVTRPLSGVSEADVVIEMPVTLNQVTRLMALYQCAHPKELGSVRSARHDFLPLAAGFDAIYSHWGGSHFALEKLAAKVLDNIDALINPHNAYWRKRGIPAPHDGFTSYERLWRAAEKLGYRLALTPSLRAELREKTPSFLGEEGPTKRKFWRVNSKGVNVKRLTTSNPMDTLQNNDDDGRDARTILIPYNPHGYAVRWEYDPERGLYERFRSGSPELDKNTGRQVQASVVAVMETTQKQLEDQYTDVKVIGDGRAVIYRQGRAFVGRWLKSDPKAPLTFVTAAGEKMALAAGRQWIEIVTR